MASEKRTQYERLESKLAIMRTKLNDTSEGATRKFGVLKEQMVKIAG